MDRGSVFKDVSTKMFEHQPIISKYGILEEKVFIRFHLAFFIKINGDHLAGSVN